MKERVARINVSFFYQQNLQGSQKEAEGERLQYGTWMVSLWDGWSITLYLCYFLLNTMKHWTKPHRMRAGGRFPTLGSSKAFFIPAVVPFPVNPAILLHISPLVLHSFFLSPF